MKVAITGASGFIGRYVAAELPTRGHRVVALGRDAAGLEALRSEGVELRATSYGEDDLVEALAGVDAIVHLAGRRTARDDEPLRYWPFAQANLRAMEALLFAARAAGASRFVLASTTAVYSGANASPFSEDDAPRPINPYALSKLQCEEMLDLWGRNGGLKPFALRIAAAYGAGERVSAVLMRFVDNALAGRPQVLSGNRQASVETIYVRDIVAAVVAALETDGAGGVYNIGSGDAASIIELADAVNDAFDNHANLDLADSRAEPSPKRFMKIDKAAAELGWKPAFSLRDGLIDFRRTLAERASPAAAAPRGLPE